MFVDIHVLQNVPPSNINRDDTGSPKTAMYGGALRARVSSQAWKRAMRQTFREYLPEDSIGIRTKSVVGLVARSIANERPELSERSIELATLAVEALGIKVVASKRSGKDEGSAATEYLVYLSPAERDGLARVAIKWASMDKLPKKATKEMANEAKSMFHGVQAVDIALFGRMLADAPVLNTDASAQVAHAISVDRISQEYDYFTAVDDCAPSDNAGAAMIETLGFNSSTLYRYATVNIDSLYQQLGDAAGVSRGLAAFIEAFVRSMPTGKQNTFANRTLPSTVIVEFRAKQPVNAVSAFESPVRAGEGESVTQKATRLLVKRLREIETAYDMPAKMAWTVCVDAVVPDEALIGERVDLGSLIEAVRGEAQGFFEALEE